MVDRQDENRFAVGPAQQCRPQQRATFQIEGLEVLRGGFGLNVGSARAQIDFRVRHGHRRTDRLQQTIVRPAEGRSQDLVAADDLIEGRPQDIAAQVAFEEHPALRMIGGALALELIEKPEPFLRE